MVAKIVRRERPTVTIWYHQAAKRVYLPQHGDLDLVRRYARRVGLPARRERPLLPGTAVRWQNATFPSATAFVVELPPGTLTRGAVRRHVRAVLAAAPIPQALAVMTRSSSLRPAIVQRHIPFGAKRKRETTAYARRHCGLNTYRLRNPHVIVEHYTGGESFTSAFDTFARDKQTSSSTNSPKSVHTSSSTATERSSNSPH
jgi:hypothetical protein